MGDSDKEKCTSASYDALDLSKIVAGSISNARITRREQLAVREMHEPLCAATKAETGLPRLTKELKRQVLRIALGRQTTPFQQGFYARQPAPKRDVKLARIL